MDGAWPIRPDGRIVCCRAVALVFFKPILRIGLRHPAHLAVTCDLCEHGGRRDVGTLAVAADDASALHGDAGVPVAVDERERRLWGQLRDGPVHGQKRRAEDIVRLDLLFGRICDAVAQRQRDDGIIERLAFYLRKLFRDVQARDLQPRRQHHRRRAHGPCQRAARGLDPAAQRLAVTAAGTIPDRGMFSVVHQSLNKKVDLTINATSYLGMANYGKVLVGDEAFEYYNDKNVNDYIQIPWSEVTEIMASVMFKGKWIPRFAVVTKNNGNFIFSTRDNKKTLRAVRNYVDPNNMVRSLSFFQVISRGLKSLFKRK